MPAKLAALTILAADPFCKMVSAQIISMMPYARTEDEAKSRVVYRKISLKAGIGLFIQGILPLVFLIFAVDGGYVGICSSSPHALLCTFCIS